MDDFDAQQEEFKGEESIPAGFHEVLDEEEHIEEDPLYPADPLDPLYTPNAKKNNDYDEPGYDPEDIDVILNPNGEEEGEFY